MARPWVLTSYPTGLYAWIGDKSSSVGSTSTAADEDHPPNTRRRATDEVAGERESSAGKGRFPEIEITVSRIAS